jgi:DNA-binding IclR family transcriptional regulator
MEALFEATRRLTQLGVLLRTDVLYLARAGSQGGQWVASPVAGRIPASCTAMGKALLAHSAVALNETIRAGLVRKTRLSITSPGVLASELVQVRRIGYAVEHEEARLGLTCVASPIVINNRAVAALSLTGPAESFDPVQAAPAVRSTARRLSQALAAQ